MAKIVVQKEKQQQEVYEEYGVSRNMGDVFVEKQPNNDTTTPL